MKFEIVKQWNMSKTFKAKQVAWNFDFQDETIVEKFTWSIDIEWMARNIWLIVWNSWTWKTTIAKELFWNNIHNFTQYNSDKSILDDIELNAEETTKLFCNVWLWSVKTRFKNYNVLSNGERMRFELAYILANKEKEVVYDEFTSVVDRTIAKTMSLCINKNIKKYDKRIILISCHKDIIEHLQPDWIFDTDTFTFTHGKTAPLKDSHWNSILSKAVQESGENIASFTI